MWFPNVYAINSYIVHSASCKDHETIGFNSQWKRGRKRHMWLWDSSKIVFWDEKSSCVASISLIFLAFVPHVFTPLSSRTILSPFGVPSGSAEHHPKLWNAWPAVSRVD